MTRSSAAVLSRLQERLVAELRKGTLLSDACATVGVSQAEVGGWLIRSEAFSDAVEGIRRFKETEARLLVPDVDRHALQALCYAGALTGSVAMALVTFVRGRPGLMGNPRTEGSPLPQANQTQGGRRRVRRR